jgi:hypothetical protein
MKDKNVSRKCVSGKQTAISSNPVNSSSPIEISHKESPEKQIIEQLSGTQNKIDTNTKMEKTKVDRPFRSRLPKLKMFIPRRPKSSSRNRNEDTKDKVKPSPRPKYSPKPSPRVNKRNVPDVKLKQSPKPTHRKFETSDLHKPHLRNSPRTSPKVQRRSPVKRGACAVSPATSRKKSPNLRNSPLVNHGAAMTKAVIESAFSPSPGLSPITTVKQQKERENETEKLKFINEILTANLSGASANSSCNIGLKKGSLSNKPSKIPIYQNIQTSNPYQKEVNFYSF